jgi:hypothetical protein
MLVSIRKDQLGNKILGKKIVRRQWPLPGKVVQALTCLVEVSGSNLGLDTD